MFQNQQKILFWILCYEDVKEGKINSFLYLICTGPYSRGLFESSFTLQA